MPLPYFLVAVLVATASFGSLAALSQSSLERFAKGTELEFSVTDNFHNGASSFLGSVSLNNNSNVALPAGSGEWQIYLHSVRKINQQEQNGIRIEHVQGDLHRLTPTGEFPGIQPGAKFQIPFEAAVWIVSYSDFMPRAFIVGKDTRPAIFSNTDTEDLSRFVAPFERSNQLRRYNDPEDKTRLADAKSRFTQNQEAGVSSRDMQQRIIPKPQRVEFKRGAVAFNKDWQIRFAGRLSGEAALFKDTLAQKYGLELQAEPDHIQAKGPTVTLSVDESLARGKAESYLVEIETNHIRIIGSDNAGAFYGMQSLFALLPVKQAAKYQIPKAKIEDSPRYAWRGMHYDNGRNYHGKAALFKLVEQMARYKLNKLHWHFSDDEGWRLEIPNLPELTEVGAFRCFDLSEQRCLLTQLGTGPFKSGSGNGFLSRKDFIELLKFAKARHVEIIPEIEGPGHARAAVKAMEARATYFENQGNSLEASRYLLSDPGDTSRYTTVQNYNDDAMNVCMDSSYAFFDKVTYELQQMYREAGSRLEHLHFGGDEVGKGAWQESPICKSLFEQADNGVAGVADLKPYFTRHIAAMLAKRGITPGAWEDGVMYDALTPFKRDEFPNTQFTVNAWDNIWEWGVADRAYRLANENYQVILSHGTHLYFDHPYEAAPEERGYYWATRYIDTQKTFGYMPDNVYANADYTRTRDKIDNLEALVGRALPGLEKPQNIIGIQGQVWTETIRTEAQLMTMVFPRLLALSERAWHKADWEGDKPDISARRKDWNVFSAALAGKELAKLARDGVIARLPIPGAKLEKGMLYANSAFAGLGIEYSLDNGASWRRYMKPVPVSEGVEPVLRSALGNGTFSRQTRVER